jgi:hypothetical protein
LVVIITLVRSYSFESRWNNSAAPGHSAESGEGTGMSVLRDKPVYRAISRRGTLSREYIRRILANMPTVITP